MGSGIVRLPRVSNWLIERGCPVYGPSRSDKSHWQPVRRAEFAVSSESSRTGLRKHQHEFHRPWSRDKLRNPRPKFTMRDRPLERRQKLLHHLKNKPAEALLVSNETNV